MTDLVFTDPHKADLICHSGKFHADEVFATALLCRIFDKSLTIARIPDMKTRINPDSIVYDIGYGELDHHQVNGNGTRKNGIPYAACGLVWNKYGMEYCRFVCSDAEFLFSEMDRFLEGIDAYDNGLFHEKNNPIINISNCIALFNPTWENCDLSAQNKAFLEAVIFADTILEKEIELIVSKINALSYAESLENNDSRILIMDKFAPILSLPSIKEKYDFAIFPSNRTGYIVKILNDSIFFPKKFRGLDPVTLAMMTGIKTALFIHNSGKLGGATELFDSIDMTDLL